ncbi:MAG TPA: ABC transporter permease [Gemmatimonadaceae bacterium]|nr:ABC transporter permease [Gemmatimonadaceae bacterium]
MQTLLQDLRYALRLLARQPAFTAIAVLTLALGIGANTAMFTVVHAVLLRPLPFRDPSALVLVAEQSNIPTITVSYQNYVDWRDQSHSFAVPLQATQAASATLTGSGEPERLPLRHVTAGLFPMLGVTPAAGRAFGENDDHAGAAPVAMISYELWQRRFNGAANVIGSVLDFDAQPYTVVGVLPQGFQILSPADVYLPFHPWGATLPDDRNWHPGIVVLGRLKPQVSRAQARTEMVAIAKHLEEQYPVYNTGTSADVVPLQARLVQNVRPALLVLLGAVSFVLLIACANVANLLLARSTARQRELAIRAAIGASRARVVRQMLTEAVLLSLAGGAAGLLLAWGALGALLKLASAALPPSIAVTMDPAVLAFTFIVAVGTGLIFGIAPALRVRNVDLRETLSDGSRGSTGGPRQLRIRGGLITAEIALAMLLLVGAGLLLQSFARLQGLSPGFKPDHLFVADLPLSPTAFSRPEQRAQFFDEVLERARALPGVRSAAAASYLPVSGAGGIIHFNITGRPPKGPRDYIATGYRTVTAGYFPTLGIPLIKGRLFTNADNERAPAVVIINQAMAHQFFPDRDPIGQRLQLGATASDEVPTMEVVGVVGDVVQGLGLDPTAEMYLPYRQADQVLPVLRLSLVMRTAGAPLQQTRALRSLVNQINPNQPIVNPRTMEDNMAATVAQPRFRTWLIGIFAALALLLAAVGIYGVMSYNVTQRTNEFGIRLTLGAQRADLLSAVLMDGLRLTVLGVVLGALGGLALTRVLTSFLFGVSASDPVTFVAVAVVLVVVAGVASLVPAYRATKMDPIAALRRE